MTPEQVTLFAYVGSGAIAVFGLVLVIGSWSKIVWWWRYRFHGHYRVMDDVPPGSGQIHLRNNKGPDVIAPIDASARGIKRGSRFFIVP